MLMNLINISLGVIFIENLLFAKFWGICPFLRASGKFKTTLKLGACTAYVMTLVSALMWPVWTYILVPTGFTYFRTPALIIIMLAVIQLSELGLRRYLPTVHTSFGIHLPSLTVSCAVMGMAMLSMVYEYSFVEAITYGFMAAVGLTLAAVLFAGIRERLEFIKCPKCMEGLPITMVSAGFIALAFMGFAGMTL